MLLNDADGDLRELIFQFFYSFSRFEYALKENSYLKSSAQGSAAMPGWGQFEREWFAKYVISASAAKLIQLNPQRQTVGINGHLDWSDVGGYSSQLGHVIALLKVVRNNLFHGGKHGAKGWDDPVRIRALLTVGLSILNELAFLGKLEMDFRGIY